MSVGVSGFVEAMLCTTVLSRMTLSSCSSSDDYYCKGREGGGQRVMIEIIISKNDDNDGRPYSQKVHAL